MCGFHIEAHSQISQVERAQIVNYSMPSSCPCKPEVLLPVKLYPGEKNSVSNLYSLCPAVCKPSTSALAPTPCAKYVLFSFQGRQHCLSKPFTALKSLGSHPYRRFSTKKVSQAKKWKAAVGTGEDLRRHKISCNNRRCHRHLYTPAINL